jgi:hypothetical protein
MPARDAGIQGRKHLNSKSSSDPASRPKVPTRCGPRSHVSMLLSGLSMLRRRILRLTTQPHGPRRRDPLLEPLRANDGLKCALVSIDAIATNAAIATAIRDAGADYLLAVKANQPTLRADVERYFDDDPATSLDSVTDLDKAHGRIEERTVTVSREAAWLPGHRRFPGELRLPSAKTIIRVRSRTALNANDPYGSIP